MKKVYLALFFLGISCLQLVFDTNIDQITLSWRHYKVSIQPSFFIFFLIVIFFLLYEVYKICSYIVFTISNVKSFWEKYQQKDLINNLFLILYYIDIDDKKNLEKVFKKIENTPTNKTKIIPTSFANLIKYLGALYLNRQDLLEGLATNLLQDKHTTISGLKALIEYRLKENDFAAAEGLLTRAKKFSKLPWTKEYEIEVEKKLGNLDKAADTLITLYKQDANHNSKTSLAEIKDLLLEQSKALHERGDVSAAKKCIKKLLALDHLNFEAQVLLIDIYIKKGNTWYANYLIKKTWKSTPSKVLLDKFTINNHKYDGLKLLKKKEELLKINSSLNAIMAFVKVFIEHNQFNKAREYLEKISAKQKSPEFYKLLSEIELKTGGDPLVISQLLEKI
jgi:hypothetical protein